MGTTTQKDRILFIIDLIKELEEINIEMESMDTSIRQETDTIHQRLLSGRKSQIDEDILNYRSNLEKIASVNSDITRQINNWYTYINDPVHKNSVFFPLNYLSKKKKLQKSLKRANEVISQLMIENRFLKEKLHTCELELEEASMSEMEQCTAFKNHTILMASKKRVVIMLNNLIPQIEGLCPVVIDLSDLSPLLARLEAVLSERTGC